MYSAIVVVIVGVVCLIIGLLVGLWYGKSGQSAEAEKTEAVKTEFNDYREAVNQHFENSAKHFAAIGQEYQALYRHMANGADALLSDDSDVRRSGFPFLPAATDIAADIVEDDGNADDETPSPAADTTLETTADASNDENAALDSESPIADAKNDENAQSEDPLASTENDLANNDADETNTPDETSTDERKDSAESDVEKVEHAEDIEVAEDAPEDDGEKVSTDK